VERLPQVLDAHRLRKDALVAYRDGPGPPAPAEEFSTAMVVCGRCPRSRDRLKTSSATSFSAWMFAHASARGSSAASMTPRCTPLFQADRPPATASAVVSCAAPYRSAASSRSQNAVEAAPL
jgi:hypothetical protein